MTQDPMTLATAAWLNLLAVAGQLEAAHIAGNQAEAERLRTVAHDLLDANLDQRALHGDQVRALINPA